MAVQRRRPSVRPVGLLVDSVPFETVETVKRPSSCPASCTRAGASSSSPVTLPSARQADLGQDEYTTFVDGVPFEPLETAKRPSSCPASFTRAGASSRSPVRLPSARQADLRQDEHNPGVETSSVHYRDGTSVAVKPVVPLSSSLFIPTSDRLLRPSIDCETALGRRNERLPGFQASDKRPPSFDHPSAPAKVSSVLLSLSSDHQADLGWKAHPPGLQAANVHHATRQRVVVKPVELLCSSPSSPSNDCRADRGQDDCPPGRQALNVHQADLAHAVFEHVNLPSSDRRPESWFLHQAAVRRGVWIGPPSLLVGQSPECRSRQVTCPQVPWTLGAQGPVVISRATHFLTRLGVVPGGPYFVGVLVSKSGNKSLFKSMNGLIHTLSHTSPFDIHKSNLHLPCTVPGTNLIVATKRGLEYPKHIKVPVQNVPREDD